MSIQLKYPDKLFIFRHFQKGGTNYTMVDVATWAENPLNENVFVVGEAYNPMRAWCEGAISSSNNALCKGWDIECPPPQKVMKKEDFIKRLKALKTKLPFP